MAAAAAEKIRPLRRVEYDKLVALGVFEGERIELIDGVLLHVSPIGAPHGDAVDRLTELFVLALAGRARVRVQGSFAAGEFSEPEPDVSILPLGDYHAEHPRQAYLIVEVAESVAEPRPRAEGAPVCRVRRTRVLDREFGRVRGGGASGTGRGQIRASPHAHQGLVAALARLPRRRA